MNIGLIKKPVDHTAKSSKKKENPNLKNEKILLSWLIEEPNLYTKIKEYIRTTDFTPGIYQVAATKVYDSFEAGEIPIPSAIMTLLQMDDSLEIEDQSEIASLFCTKISDDLRLVRGIRDVDLTEETEEFDTKLEKEKALMDVIISIKKASLQTFMENGIIYTSTY